MATATWHEVRSGATVPLDVDGVMLDGDLYGAQTDPARELVWSEEFDGPAGAAPDPARWTHATGGGGWGNGELQGYTASTANAALDGEGRLAITARAEPGPGGTAYTSARITTEASMSVLHGYVEARIKLPQPTQGIWPAFWLLGDPAVGWPACGELDVLEAVNDLTEVSFNTHQPTIYNVQPSALDRWQPSLPPASAPAGTSWADDWHRYAVDWTPHEIRWLIDGEVRAALRRRDRTGAQRWVLADQPQHVILNVAVGGSYPGPPDGTTALPRTMLIDYVRVYATADTTVEIA